MVSLFMTLIAVNNIVKIVQINVINVIKKADYYMKLHP